MFLDQPLAWAAAHLPAVLTAGVLVALVAGLAAYIAHRTSSYVLAAGIGALVCTSFSADTSWRFADHTLHMEATERLWLFAAGEITLIVFAIMARANKLATATDDQAGTPGVPGVLVWCIACVQLVPAFAESGIVGGLIRSVFGPVMAALLWHLAMGLEVRLAKPEALSTGLPAQIGHELRERLLSHLGLATRNRTAEEITRDRAHARVVRLGSRRHLGPWGRARLAAAVARSRVTVDGSRRHRMLQELAGRRTADQLRTMDVASPWASTADTQPQPPTTQPQPGDFDSAAAAALAVAQPTPPQPAVVADAQPDAAAPAGHGALVLDLAPMLPVQPELLDGNAPLPSAAQPHPQPQPSTAAPVAGAAAATRSQVAPLRSPDSDAEVLKRARALNTQALADTGSPVSQRQLQRELGIGQRRAQRIHAQLPTATATDAAAAAAAQSSVKEA